MTDNSSGGRKPKWVIIAGGLASIAAVFTAIVGLMHLPQPSQPLSDSELLQSLCSGRRSYSLTGEIDVCNRKGKHHDPTHCPLWATSELGCF